MGAPARIVFPTLDCAPRPPFVPNPRPDYFYRTFFLFRRFETLSFFFFHDINLGSLASLELEKRELRLRSFATVVWHIASRPVISTGTSV